MALIDGYRKFPDQNINDENERVYKELINGYADAGADLKIRDGYGLTVFDHADRNADFRSTNAYWVLHDKQYQ
jgi:hypothetical protein